MLRNSLDLNPDRDPDSYFWPEERWATFVPIVRVDRPVVGQPLPEIPPEDSVHQLTSSAILTEKNAGLWIRIRMDLH